MPVHRVVLRVSGVICLCPPPHPISNLITGWAFGGGWASPTTTTILGWGVNETFFRRYLDGYHWILGLEGF